MESTANLSNQSSRGAMVVKAVALKILLLRSVMLLFLFMACSLTAAEAADYITVGSISELKAKCESGEIKYQDKVYIDIDFTIQQKYQTDRFFINDINNPSQFLTLKSFNKILYPEGRDLSQLSFRGLFGVIWCDNNNIQQLILTSGTTPDELLDKVHQPIAIDPDLCLPIIADEDFFSGVDNFGKIFKLDGNVTVSNKELTIGGKKVQVLGTVSTISNKSKLIGGFYDIYNGTPEVYITEVWTIGSEPERTIKAVGEFGGSAMIGATADGIDKRVVSVMDGEEVWLKATPDRGYVFESWTVCGDIVSTEAECSVVASSNSTYRANFRADGAPQIYQIIVKSNDESLGNVEIEVNHSVVDDGQFDAEAGTTITLKAMSVDNAGFDGWYAEGKKLSGEEVYSFAASKGVAIEARFYQRYVVEIAAAEMGTVVVKANGLPVNDGALVAEGATIEVYAIPESGMELKSLTINGVERANPFTMTTESDIAISAKFIDPTAVIVEDATSLADLRDNHPDGRKVRITTPLTVVMEKTGQWLITDGNTTGIAALPSTANAAAGMVFSELEGECKNYDGVCYINDVKVVKAENVEPTSILPQAVSVDKLQMMAAQYVTISNAELTQGDGGEYIISDNSRIGGFAAKFPVCIYVDSKDLADFSNKLKDGPVYTVKGFVGSLGGKMGLIMTQLPEVTGNTNLVKVSIFVDDTSHGRSWMTVGDDETEVSAADIVNGESVTLHAEAAEGFEFVGWKFFGEISGAENPKTVEITAPSTFTAIFSEKEPAASEQPTEPITPGGDEDDDTPALTKCSVTITQSAHGVIRAYCDANEISSGARYPEGTAITIVATADEGYHLQQMLVDGNPMESSTEGKLTIRLTTDVTVTAIFERNMPAYASLSVAAAEWLEGEPMGTVYIDRPGTTSVSAIRGETHAFHAEPAEGCRFVGWRVQGGNAIQNTSDVFNLVAAENLMLVAEFDYVITTPRRVSVRPSRADKGIVKIEGTGLTELTSRRYLHISAESSGPDHEFAGWIDETGRLISTGNAIVYSDASATELIANFNSAYFVTLTAEGQGTIISPSTDLSKRIAEGSIVRIIIAPAANHELAGVTIDGVNTVAQQLPDGSYFVDLTVDAPHAVSATFALRKFTVMFSSHAHGELAVYSEMTADGRPAGNKLSSGLLTPYDTELHVYITPDDDYKIETLTVNGTSMALDKLKREGETVYFNLPVHTDVAIVATFVYDGHTTSIAMPEADPVSPDSPVYDLNGRVRGTIAGFSSLPAGIYLVPSNSGAYKKIVKH